MVQVIHASAGELVCCNQPMQLMEENTVDAATEKHVPVITKIDGGYEVSVGSVEHPMLDEHWIEWIELVADGKSYRQYLNPGDKPVARFYVEAEEVSAREFCNLHGLWKA
jgi:superoxide reductase